MLFFVAGDWSVVRPWWWLVNSLRILKQQHCKSPFDLYVVAFQVKPLLFYHPVLVYTN